MKLLCFAHRLEANHFLSAKAFKAKNPALFESADELVLITGEGLQAATESLCEVLASNQGITSVYNLGVAAANTDILKLNQIYSIRTLYRQKNFNSMEFTSFTSSDENAATDIVSVDTRIQSSESAKLAFSFAPMIDREAWAFASVCKRFQVPFYAFKYASDDATREACTQVRDLASQISEALYLYFLEYVNRTTQVQEKLDLPFGYHFTFTQAHDFEKLVHKLSLKESKSKDEIISSLPQVNKQKPKDATKELLNELRKRLDPFTFSIQSKLNEIVKDFNTKNISISYDKTFESDQIQILTSASSTEDIHAIKEQLDKIPLQQIHDLLRGKHVE